MVKSSMDEIAGNGAADEPDKLVSFLLRHGG
jgi:hypothetical protein